MRLLREITTGPDALQAMLLELRQQRPPVYLADERERWFAAIGLTIAGMSNRTQRLAAIDAVTLDLWAAYGMPKPVAQNHVHVAVFAADVEGNHERI